MKFIFIDNISIYIDLRFLKESYHSGNLKNANVFAELDHIYYTLVIDNGTINVYNINSPHCQIN
jgi:hypothetical protein